MRFLFVVININDRKCSVVFFFFLFFYDMKSSGHRFLWTVVKSYFHVTQTRILYSLKIISCRICSDLYREYINTMRLTRVALADRYPSGEKKSRWQKIWKLFAFPLRRPCSVYTSCTKVSHFVAVRGRQWYVETTAQLCNHHYYQLRF